MALSVQGQALDFGSGHDLDFLSSTLAVWSLMKILSLPPLPYSHALSSLSLPKLIIKKKTKMKKTIVRKRKYRMVLYLLKKNLYVWGLPQSKPILFKGPMYTYMMSPLRVYWNLL